MTTSADPAEHNPFAAPQTMDYAADVDTRPAAIIRQQYLTHEASVSVVECQREDGFFGRVS